MLKSFKWNIAELGPCDAHFRKPDSEDCITKDNTRGRALDEAVLITLWTQSDWPSKL